MQQQGPTQQGQVILADHLYARYVQLSADYTDDTDYYASIKRLEAAYDGRTTVIYRLHSEEAPSKCVLSADAFERLVAGRLHYLAEHGMAERSPLLEEAFTMYLHACEQQAARLGSGTAGCEDTGVLDDHPF